MQIPSVSLEAVRTSAPHVSSISATLRFRSVPTLARSSSELRFSLSVQIPSPFGLRNSTAHFDTAQSSTCARRAIRSPFGYIGFYDPAKKRGGEFFAVADQRAERRLKVKKSAKGARRSVRYSRLIKPIGLSRL